MAQSRTQTRGGMTAVHIWLIGFVFLWLVSMVLLVWLYTDQESITKDNDDLRNRYAKVIAKNEERLPWFGQARSGGPTAVGLLEEARKQTAVLAIGEEAGDAETVRSQVRALLDRILDDRLIDDPSPYETDAVLPAMAALYDSFGAERRLRVAAEDRAAALESQYQELVEVSERRGNEFDESTDRLKADLTKLEQDRAAYGSARDQEVEEFGTKLNDRQQQYARNIQEQRDLVQREQKRLEELQSRYAELQGKLGELQIGPGALLTARQADGQVVMAQAGDDVVYINLGRKHRLTAGLQFAVYPPDTGIEADGRSKARIEVVRVQETTAVCRIVAINDIDVVVEGDLIANPVFDRNRALRFMVVGEFDLNGDGQSDPFGADQIKGLVADWGGEVVDALSSRLDFVVAGYAPEPPAPSARPKLSREDQERRRMIERRISHYNEIISSADQLSIPMLSQDVFLRFLGF